MFRWIRTLRTKRLLARQTAMLWELDAGALDGLKCPACGERAVSVWFTHPQDFVYRTWFLCRKCPFQMRAQDTGRPKFFADERVHQHLDAYDTRLISALRLPNPEA